MERLDRNVRAIDARFEQRPEVFHPIRVNMPVNVLLRVVDDLVRVVAIQDIVGEQFIGDDFRPTTNALSHHAAQIMLATSLYVLDMNSARLALKQAEHDLLSERAASLDALGAFASVHVAGFAADKGFVGFHSARHLSESTFLHRETNPMIHEPRGFLSDAKPAMKFVTADSVLATDHQPRGGEPLLKRNRGVFKNVASLQRKRRTLVLGVAFPHTRLCQPCHVVRSTLRALNNAIRPAEFGHELPAVLEIREPDNRLVERVWRFHKTSMKQERRYGKYITTEQELEDLTLVLAVRQSRQTAPSRKPH